MSYRDDEEALFQRATALQEEVDRLRAELAERDKVLESGPLIMAMPGFVSRRIDEIAERDDAIPIEPPIERGARVMRAGTPPPLPEPNARDRVMAMLDELSAPVLEAVLRIISEPSLIWADVRDERVAEVLERTAAWLRRGRTD